MPEPTCEAPVAPGEVCGLVASWIVEGDDLPDGRMLLCQEHNDYDLQHNPAPNERKGVWEEFENGEESTETLEDANRKKFVPPNVTVSDIHGWILQKAGQGWPEGLLWKIAGVSLRRYIEATDRWEKLEYGRDKTAPLWLDEREAKKLSSMLRGLKGAEARAIRQTIDELFDA